jgi:hypothetical protein
MCTLWQHLLAVAARFHYRWLIVSLIFPSSAAGNPTEERWPKYTELPDAGC